MMSVASLVLVGFYFEKNRAVATTIATCGSSLGAALLAPLIRAMITEYSWNGAIIMLSGLVLNGAVLGKNHLPFSWARSQVPFSIHQ